MQHGGPQTAFADPFLPVSVITPFLGGRQWYFQTIEARRNEPQQSRRSGNSSMSKVQSMKAEKALLQISLNTEITILL